MASGAGLQVDAIQTLRRNRSLLKGKNLSKYKNFDKDSYQVKRKIKGVLFKNSTSEMLALIKSDLAKESIKSKRRSLLILSTSLLGAIILMILLGKLYLFLFF